MSRSRTALKGCLAFHSGCSGASLTTRSRAKASCVYMGCSTHRVPSLSKVATRSDGWTKSAEPSRVTAATKSKIDCLARPLFQDGRGSVAWVWAEARHGSTCRAGSAERAERTKRRSIREGFIIALLRLSRREQREQRALLPAIR